MILGETPTFDTFDYSEIDWGLYRDDRTREVSVGGYTLANTTHCTDPQSRQLMTEFYDKNAERLNELKRKNN